MKKEIKINGVTYTLKNSLRNLFIFEGVTNRTFNVKRTFDWIVLFYSTLLANNESFNMELDHFISLCDEHPEAFKEFQQFIIDASRTEAQRATNNDVKKKTNPRRKK